MSDKVYSLAEVAKHNTEESAWTIVEGGVYGAYFGSKHAGTALFRVFGVSQADLADVSGFLSEHPGGKKILLNSTGRDSTEKFWKFHSKRVLTKSAAPMLIGRVAESKL